MTVSLGAPHIAHKATAAKMRECVQEDFMRAVRKMNEAKKLESTLNYDSAFGDGKSKS